MNGINWNLSNTTSPCLPLPLMLFLTFLRLICFINWSLIPNTVFPRSWYIYIGSQSISNSFDIYFEISFHRVKSIFPYRKMRNCALSKLYYLIPLHIVIIDKYFKESIHPSKMFPNLRVIRLISPRRECYVKRNLSIQRRQTVIKPI